MLERGYKKFHKVEGEKNLNIGDHVRLSLKKEKEGNLVKHNDKLDWSNRIFTIKSIIMSPTFLPIYYICGKVESYFRTQL